MAHRDIIVIGASMGGLDALPRVIEGLPENLGASIFVVLHMASGGSEYLPARFNRVGRLYAAAAEDGERIEPNRIYCAVADRHLAIEGDRIRLTRAPKESHARPSIDVLFRSAALAHAERVIGVVLTGMLDDGTAGLWSIKDRGGVAIVQSPAEAAYPSMPASAARHVRVDHVSTLAEMPALLVSLVRSRLEASPETRMPDEKLRIENAIALERQKALEGGVRRLGEQSFFTCPDCHGSMVAIEDGTFKRYRCHTGHGFTPAALSERGLEEIEKRLWSALAHLEEREVLLHEMEQSVRELTTDGETAERYSEQRQDTRRVADRVRELLHDPAFGRNPREQ